jgi:hypothetical protein
MAEYIDNPRGLSGGLEGGNGWKMAWRGIETRGETTWQKSHRKLAKERREATNGIRLSS